MSNFKYLIEQERDRRWGLVVTTVGQQIIEKGQPYPSQEHPRRYCFSSENGRILQDYQVVYITRGHGWFMSAHVKRTEVNAGDILLLFPDEWHNYAPYSETGWDEQWIGFSGKFADDLVKEGFLSVEKPVMRIGVIDQLWRYFGEACSVAQKQQAAFQQQLSGLAVVILGTVYAADKQSSIQDVAVISKINEAKKYIRENITAIESMEEVARAVGMGYSKFRRMFKDYTGVPPAQYIIQMRIALGKELLTNTDNTCQEIAYKLGFESPSYFNTIFHKKVRMTPNEYRKLTRAAKPSHPKN